MAKFPRADVLPWILGALLVAAAIPAVIAISGISPGMPAPRDAGHVATADARSVDGEAEGSAMPGATASAAPSAAAPVGSGGTTATPAPLPTGMPGPPTAATLSPASLPAGEVWECEIDGAKTFSDAPCGPGATRRRLHDVNGMDVSPQSPTAYAPPPGYGPPSGHASPPGYSPPAGYYASPGDAYGGSAMPDTPDGDEAGATTVIGATGLLVARGHPNHRHDPPPRPPHHDHRAPPPAH